MLKLKIHVVTGMKSCGSRLEVFCAAALSHPATLRLLLPLGWPFTLVAGLKIPVLNPEIKALVALPLFFRVSLVGLPSVHVEKGAGQERRW